MQKGQMIQDESVKMDRISSRFSIEVLLRKSMGGLVVWRFPYMAGQEGGAAFILVYIGSVLLLGIPCMISEFIIGRHGRRRET